MTFKCLISFNQVQKSVEEERYGDAALIRDCAGAGLVSWPHIYDASAH